MNGKGNRKTTALPNYKQKDMHRVQPPWTCQESRSQDGSELAVTAFQIGYGQIQGFGAHLRDAA